MKTITWNKENTTALITMDNGENRHNPDFLYAMLKVFDEIEADPATTAVVLASRDPKYWSLGIDLEWITGALGNGQKQTVRDFMYDLNRLSARILTFPLPVIAAIGGHTFGDGAMLAMACDFRFMKADRGFFCFPEVDINIPFLPSMLEIIRKAIPGYALEEFILSGRKIPAAELAEHHVIIEACTDEEEMLKTAMDYARSFTKGRAIFAEHKKRLHKGILDMMEQQDPAYIEPLILTA